MDNKREEEEEEGGGENRQREERTGGQRRIQHTRAQRTKDTQSKDIVLDGREQKTIAIAHD